MGGWHPGVALLAWYQHQGAIRGVLPASSIALLRLGGSGHDYDG
jgi:hypothetical protein